MFLWGFLFLFGSLDGGGVCGGIWVECGFLGVFIRVTKLGMY